MLVVARRDQEKIIVKGPDGLRIVVQVTRIKGETVRIGIEAPKEFNIVRGELENGSNSK